MPGSYRDHRADVIEALGEWVEHFDVEAITAAAARAGGVGALEPQKWEALLRQHTISGPLFDYIKASSVNAAEVD